MKKRMIKTMCRCWLAAMILKCPYSCAECVPPPAAPVALGCIKVSSLYQITLFLRTESNSFFQTTTSKAPDRTGSHSRGTAVSSPSHLFMCQILNLQHTTYFGETKKWCPQCGDPRSWHCQEEPSEISLWGQKKSVLTQQNTMAWPPS